MMFDPIIRYIGIINKVYRLRISFVGVLLLTLFIISLYLFDKLDKIFDAGIYASNFDYISKNWLPLLVTGMLTIGVGNVAFDAMVQETAVIEIRTDGTVVSYSTSNTAIGVYKDIFATQNLTEIIWGEVEAGDTTNFTFYVRNEGTNSVSLLLSQDEPNPTYLFDYVTLTWSDIGNILSPGRSRKIVMWLQSDPDIQMPTSNKNVNQQSSGGTWYGLGTFQFEVGSGSVVLSDEASGIVIADAIRLEHSLTHEVIIVDTGQADYVGTWQSSTLHPGYWGTDYRWTEGGIGADTATWNFDIPTAGSWWVYARWSSADNRATIVPYTIYHAGIDQFDYATIITALEII